MEFLHGHVHGSISGSGIRCLHIPKGKLQPLVVVCGDQNVTLSFYLQMRLKSEMDKQGGIEVQELEADFVQRADAWPMPLYSVGSGVRCHVVLCAVLMYQSWKPVSRLQNPPR